MNVIRYSPGVPDGYKPQKQRVEPTATVLISEWARKAAHELNDRHHNWIEARLKDEFADENLNEAQLRDAIDHTAMLMKWDLIEEYLPKLERDLSMIYAYISFLQRNKEYVSRRKVGLQQWAAHLLAQQEELAYKTYLQKILKYRRSHFVRAVNEKKYQLTDKIKTDLDVVGVIWEVYKAVFHRACQLTTEPMTTLEERAALKRIGGYLKERKEQMLRQGLVMPEDLASIPDFCVESKPQP